MCSKNDSRGSALVRNSHLPLKGTCTGVCRALGVFYAVFVAGKREPVVRKTALAREGPSPH